VKTKETLIPAYSKGVIGDATIDMSTQCLSCKHLNNNMTTCIAFPDSIPDKILLGKFDHTKPFTGDNGTLYEPIKSSRSNKWPFKK